MNLAEYIESRRDQHLTELCEFLRIPSVSAKSEHKPDIEKAAQWVAGNLRSAGFKTVEIVPTKFHPLVYAESLEAPGKPTVLFYGHYDVQPAEPLDLWTSPAFDPQTRNGNLYGRGTADDKGQVHIHLKALQSLQKVNGKLPITLVQGDAGKICIHLFYLYAGHLIGRKQFLNGPLCEICVPQADTDRWQCR